MHDVIYVIRERERGLERVTVCAGCGLHVLEPGEVVDEGTERARDRVRLGDESKRGKWNIGSDMAGDRDDARREFPLAALRRASLSEA